MILSFLTLFFLLINFTLGSTDLQKVSLETIKTYEDALLKKYVKETPSNLQAKYLEAAIRFSEQGEFEKAIYLAEKGIRLAPPPVELQSVYLRSVLGLDQNDRFLKEFERLSYNYPFRKEDVESYSEILQPYLLLKGVLSRECPDNQMDYIIASPFIDQFKWSDSITSAKREKFSDALKSLKEVQINNPEDHIYLSYLQVKIGQLPKYCLRNLKRQAPFPVTCRILMKKDLSKIEDELRSTEEITKFTPLYEVLFK